MELSERVTLYTDGKYRWEYIGGSVSHNKTPFAVWKFGAAVLIIFLAIAELPLIGDTEAMKERFEAIMFAWGLVFFIFFVTGIVLFINDSFLYRGKYQVTYEMDNETLIRRRIGKDEGRENLLVFLSMLSPLKSERHARNEIADDIGSKITFSKVKKIKLVPQKNLIIVKQALESCYVYVSAEDYDTVLEHIKKCTE